MPHTTASLVLRISMRWSTQRVVVVTTSTCWVGAGSIVELCKCVLSRLFTSGLPARRARAWWLS